MLRLIKLFRRRKTGTELCLQHHHKAVRASVVRTLHRLGMTGRVEIKPFDAGGQPPALFITVERNVVKVSQAAMAMLAKEIVAHAKRKYATEIEGVYWRIDADFEAQDDLGDDVLGPTTLGYLVEETTELHHQACEQLSEMERMISAIATEQSDSADVCTLSRQIRDSIDLRRHERGIVDMQHHNTRTEEVPQ